MGLRCVRALLAEARVGGYGVPAFNIGDATMIEPVLEACEQRAAPAILAFYGGHFSFFDPGKVIPFAVRCAERARVPVAVHLDHISDFDLILKGIRYGATGVMVDGSRLPYEDNVAITRKVISVCRPLGVTVEAELGIMGGAGAAASCDAVDPSNFTKPEQAEDFTNQTQVDALAIAYGSVHGDYKGVPMLDFPRLAEIRRRSSAYLVLHGGSGLTDADFQKSIENGISKINIFTELSKASILSLRKKLADEPENISLPDVLRPARKAIADGVARLLDVFWASGKAK